MTAIVLELKKKYCLPCSLAFLTKIQTQTHTQTDSRVTIDLVSLHHTGVSLILRLVCHFITLVYKIRVSLHHTSVTLIKPGVSLHHTGVRLIKTLSLHHSVVTHIKTGMSLHHTSLQLLRLMFHYVTLVCHVLRLVCHFFKTGVPLDTGVLFYTEVYFILVLCVSFQTGESCLHSVVSFQTSVLLQTCQ